MSYGTPPPGQYPPPPYGAVPPRQHGSAVTALVLGILSFVVCGLLGIPAYIVGKAEQEIRASNGLLTGEGMAKAGWILGLIAMILMVVALVVVVLVFALGGVVKETFGNQLPTISQSPLG
jgi:ABC-type Fe3+ transport system permease subunit